MKQSNFVKLIGKTKNGKDRIAMLGSICEVLDVDDVSDGEEPQILIKRRNDIRWVDLTNDRNFYVVPSY